MLLRTKARSAPRFSSLLGINSLPINKHPPVFPTEGKFSRESLLQDLVVTATQSFLDTMFLLTPENFPLECAMRQRRRQQLSWRSGKEGRAPFHLWKGANPHQQRKSAQTPGGPRGTPAPGGPERRSGEIRPASGSEAAPAALPPALAPNF